MKKKLITSYSIIFIAIFIILFFANIIYKKYLVNLDFFYKYQISSIQYFDLKKESIHKLVEDIFENEKKINSYNQKTVFKIDELEIIAPSSYDQIKNKSKIKFNLITNLNINEKEMENKINKIYFASIDNVLKELEETHSIYDYETLEKLYEKTRKEKVLTYINRLEASEFYKKYKPVKCNDTNYDNCLIVYQEYYEYIYMKLKNNTDLDNLANLLNLKNRGIKFSNLEILEDFISNKFLYDFSDLFSLRPMSDLTYHKYSFFNKKYKEFLNSETFLRYFLEDSSFCFSYNTGCFLKVSEQLNSKKIKLKLERNTNFNIKKINSKRHNVFLDFPIILALTSLITYFLFIFRNKFFIKKLK